MLSKFSVSNFKSFNSKFTFDLQETNRYEFNNSSVRNDVVAQALIYGHNGVGKSNLGLALFDITHHLTDFQKGDEFYKNYFNADSNDNCATFYYEFKFGNNIVDYKYEKNINRVILRETLNINGKTIAHIDKRQSTKAEIKLKGTESLNSQLNNTNLSLLKYIKFNSVLPDDENNLIFSNFYEFVEGMLFFRSLDNNMYIGLETGNSAITSYIIENELVKHFETFLNDSGIRCSLTFENNPGNQTLYFKFQNSEIPFFDLASTGTKSLTLLYYWLRKIESNSKTSFVFIDEFDAFYHHDLASSVVRLLKSTDLQFILTTHNTTNISNEILRPDCYFLMYKANIKSLAKSTDKELREAHNIEKMYRANLFQFQL